MTAPNGIAFLGTGLMGAPMVRRLLAAGFDVTVWNRTREKAEALALAGARLADKPSAAVAGAGVVITMLESGPIVSDVVFRKGVASAMRQDTTFIDMSSTPPSTARKHAEKLAEGGIEAIDAPVSGGTVGAEQGTLAIMAGGDARRIADLKPVFDAMGRVIHVGPAGAGQLAKLANQAIVAVTIGAVAEGLLLAAAGGADPASVRDAIRGGFAESRILDLHGARMVARDFVPGAPSRIQLKDLDTILAEAQSLGLDLPLVRNVRDRFAMLCNAGLGETDHSALLLELEQRNMPVRLGDAPNRMPG
ncbi:MAG: NAD(P)-dependent oxidoreductase [Rhodobiaceae bacterium]|nr:NAD(P)-dependent oxidoreductase [Rhodobiaceae bacterium]MCC0054157.1 NAD(P)-dependent oxidoreductase [Rhodobiaceae bacterium]